MEQKIEQEHILIRTLSVKKLKTGGTSAIVHLPPTIIQKFGFELGTQVLVRITPKRIVITPLREELARSEAKYPEERGSSG